MSNDRIDQEMAAFGIPIACDEPKGRLLSHKKKIVVCILLTCIVGAGFAGQAWYSQSEFSSAKSPSQVAEQQAASIVAKVNGLIVTESEVSGLVQQGVDRAIAIDRYINKVLAAEKGRELYGKESNLVLQAAEREVLATLYTTRRMQEFRDAITDAQITDYYNKNVLDENFKLWKVSYYLSADASDIQNTLGNMKNGDVKALAQLKPLVDQGDGFAATTALPYNLGRVVNKLKRGDFSEILSLRNGFLVLRIDDFKQIEKPKLDAVKDEIRQALALQKFNEELEQVRKDAKVELG